MDESWLVSLHDRILGVSIAAAALSPSFVSFMIAHGLRRRVSYVYSPFTVAALGFSSLPSLVSLHDVLWSVGGGAAAGCSMSFGA
jgi:hypothetical protein